MKTSCFILTLTLFTLGLPAVWAQQGEPATSAAPTPQPQRFVTQHTIETPRGPLSYTAIAGETVIKDETGDPSATFFTIAYLQDSADPSTRPLTFLFNGGPGSTAVWLHLGAFGPKRIDLSDKPLEPGSPPYKLEPNRHTLLTYSDLVFVDPVGTGFSRALGEHSDAEFWGVDEDGAALAQFVRKYLTENRRWASPKYLTGESYGTIRAAIMVRDLQLDLLDSVALNGVILISAALDTRIFMSGQPGNELNYVTNLPTYAATAFFHNALASKATGLETFLEEARAFAATEYLAALFAGDSLTPEKADRIAKELSRFTGLSPEYLKRADLRVNTQRFLKELLRDRGLVMAVHDTRFTGTDPDNAGEFVAFDPFMTAISGPFVTGINSYLTDELKVDMGQHYEVFNLQIPQSWKRSVAEQHVFAGHLHTTQFLSQAAAVNRDFRVFAASGYHDLTTTFFGVEYIFDHSGIDKNRLTVENYFGGHMMYLHDSSLEKLSADVGAFIEDGLAD